MPKIQTLRIGHLSTVDHLVLGIAASGQATFQDKQGLNLCPVPFGAWEPLCQGLKSGSLDGALISIPLAMALSGTGLDLTLVMLSHRGGSVLAARPHLARLSDYRGKSLLVPHKFSIQHMLMHKLCADKGLILSARASEGVCAESVPMPLMPEMVQNDKDSDIAALISSDPFAAKAILNGDMKLVLTTQALWKDHPCCGLVVRQPLMAGEKVLRGLILGLFKAASALHQGLQGRPDSTILDQASAFLGQGTECTARALTGSGVTYNPVLLVPEQAPLEMVQDYMVNTMGLTAGPWNPDRFNLDRFNLDRFVNPTFALTALSELNP